MALKPPSRPRRASFSLLFSPKAPDTSHSPESHIDRLTKHMEYFRENALPCCTQAELPRIPNSWTQLLSEHQKLPPRTQKQQAAIWELLDTEVHYLEQLAIVIDVFLYIIRQLQQSNDRLLCDISTEHLFSNIEEVYGLNRKFWTHFLEPIVDHLRQSGEPLKPSILCNGFLKFEEHFFPYTNFCIEQHDCISYLKTKEKNSPTFCHYMIGANHIAQGREELGDLLIKPVQRLTKYKILLERIKDYTDDEYENERLKQMLNCVDRFVSKVNKAVSRHDERVKVCDINNRIESYDVVELVGEECAKLLEPFTILDLTLPICGCSAHRNVMHQGALKLKEGQNKWVETTCYLFTDIFLITKTSKRNPDKIRVVKSPVRVDRTHCRKLGDGQHFMVIALNEFDLLSAAFIFNCDQRKVDEWMDKFDTAKKSLHGLLESKTTGVGGTPDSITPTTPISVIGGGSGANGDDSFKPMGTSLLQVQAGSEASPRSSVSSNSSHCLTSPIQRRRMRHQNHQSGNNTAATTHRLHSSHQSPSGPHPMFHQNSMPSVIVGLEGGASGGDVDDVAARSTQPHWHSVLLPGNAGCYGNEGNNANPDDADVDNDGYGDRRAGSSPPRALCHQRLHRKAVSSTSSSAERIVVGVPLIKNSCNGEFSADSEADLKNMKKLQREPSTSTNSSSNSESYYTFSYVGGGGDSGSGAQASEIEHVLQRQRSGGGGGGSPKITCSAPRRRPPEPPPQICHHPPPAAAESGNGGGGRSNLLEQKRAFLSRSMNDLRGSGNSGGGGGGITPPASPSYRKERMSPDLPVQGYAPPEFLMLLNARATATDV